MLALESRAQPTMKPIWSISLFAELAAERNGVRFDTFRTRKAAELLAVIALRAGHTFSRDSLVELLWPERDPKTGLAQLRVELSSLRTGLEPNDIERGSILATDRNTIRLNRRAVVTDVALFEQAISQVRQANEVTQKVYHLRKAVELYGGELLPGLDSDWIEQERRRLAERQLWALIELATLLPKEGQAALAFDYAHRATNHDPLDEQAHEVLIRLYVSEGRLTMARTIYQRFAARFKAELGVEPAQTLRQLIEP
jgi:DNA-binding SARP family transcriptional activator